ncbi:hypothetical protein DAEQUDRAFT_746187 [Daedalea quercina L-15889]|uniref:Uncharacterized protein n=1 Tax=Daedalea quercina L-15889 TaxID=1314783 RepID=A0A165NUJ6_9APHY|nr:hypothetical protein DAEQUDRAFT_746187 [Daedalea quercina L-15889]
MGDGSEWAVCEDWEAEAGLVNDLFLIADNARSDSETGTAATCSHIATLMERFKNELLFLEVVQALNDVDGQDAAVAWRARHRAEQYHIEGAKLWRNFGSIRAPEATAMAEQQHKEGRHWGRDAVKLVLMDQVWSPKLDQSCCHQIRIQK